MDEHEKRAKRGIDRRARAVADHGRDHIIITEEFRRDRGVRAGSEVTVPGPCRDRRDELALSERKRRWSAHHFLREKRQKPGAVRPVVEKVQDLRDGEAGAAHPIGSRSPRAYGVMVFNSIEIHVD